MTLLEFMLLNVVEIVAVVFSLASVYLAIKISKWTWPIGIIGVIAYAILFYQVALYADFGLQFIYLAQGLYGWWYWIGGKKKIEPPVKKVSNIYFVNVCLNIIFYSTILGAFLAYYTNAALPYVDSTASIISLTANWLLAKKKLQAWYLWIFVDVLYVGIFTYKELYLSSILYFIFFVMAIVGYLKWRKELIK